MGDKEDLEDLGDKEEKMHAKLAKHTCKLARLPESLLLTPDNTAYIKNRGKDKYNFALANATLAVFSQQDTKHLPCRPEKDKHYGII